MPHHAQRGKPLTVGASAKSADEPVGRRSLRSPTESGSRLKSLLRGTASSSRRPRRRALALLSIIVLIAALAAGCGGDSGGDDTAPAGGGVRGGVDDAQRQLREHPRRQLGDRLRERGRPERHLDAAAHRRRHVRRLRLHAAHQRGRRDLRAGPRLERHGVRPGDGRAAGRSSTTRPRSGRTASPTRTESSSA